jgi:hypothetical protein
MKDRKIWQEWKKLVAEWKTTSHNSAEFAKEKNIDHIQFKHAIALYEGFEHKYEFKAPYPEEQGS